MRVLFPINPLSKTEKADSRRNFACGNSQIDNYFHEKVSQDVKKDFAKCFVAREKETSKIAGFYTLSAGGILLEEIPATLRKKLPRYPQVPAVRIGWLARDLQCKGIGLGEILVMDAIKKILEAPIGVYAVFVDAIDEKAIQFYKDLGFSDLEKDSSTLLLPIKTTKGIF